MAQQIFERQQFQSPPKSAFDLTHNKKLSCNMGQLIPALLMEVLPGDHFRVTSNLLAKLAPLLSPAMVEIDAYMHYFFVPNRLVWDDWEDFITGGDPDEADPVMPTHTPAVNQNHGLLLDYMGLPTRASGSFSNAYTINALPFRGYRLIYNEFYRDQNLIDEIDITSGSNTILTRAWHKDYFTSAFLEPQKGEPIYIETGDVPNADATTWLEQNISTYPGGSWVPSGTNAASRTDTLFDSADGILKTNAGQYVHKIDGSGVGIDIISLRRASALQRFLEMDMQGGNRYIEHLRVHYGEQNGDLRLQRPQYLGGGKQPIIISEILNTAASQGEMTGHGMSVGNVNSFEQKFSEHGYVFGILSILPRMAYAQGIPKHFHRTNRFDYYFPILSDIGEQEIQNAEVYFDGSVAFDAKQKDDLATAPYQTFGYQQRYAEYKYQMDTVHGEFKDQAKLGSWTFKRDYDHFAGAPTLSEAFIECDHAEIDEQIFAAANEDHKCYVEIENVVQARRPMPYFANYKLQ